MTENIPLLKWGKDHWSTFAYIETIAVDNNGIISPNPLKMRTNHKIHPHISNPIDGSSYPTILRDGETVDDHDDWNCLEDAEKEGLLKNIGTGLNITYKLTEKGWHVAHDLRMYKAHGGTFKNFSRWFDKDWMGESYT